jgi:hypothetical protein
MEKHEYKIAKIYKHQEPYRGRLEGHETLTRKTYSS